MVPRRWVLTLTAASVMVPMIIALAVIPEFGDLTVRNPHTGRVRPTPRRLSPPPLDVRPPARDQSGPMDILAVPDGDRVRMIIGFGGRKFFAVMAPEDADRVATMFAAAAAQADASRLSDVGQELLAEAAASIGAAPVEKVGVHENR